MSDFRQNDGHKQLARRTRELPADPSSYSRRGPTTARGGGEYQRPDLRDTREHSDPTSTNRRELLKYRSSLESKDIRDIDWDPESFRRDPRDIGLRNCREISTTSGLRETRICSDGRDFRDEMSSKEFRNNQSAREFRDYRASNRDFTDHVLDPRKFDLRDRLDYLDSRERRDPYDPRSIDRRYNLPLRKNDSMSDLREERHLYDRHDGSYYRSEHNRFPHHHSMRESRRDVQDRLENERRGYYGANDKRDQTYLRRQYTEDGIPPYRGSSGGADYHLSLETSGYPHEAIKRMGGGAALMDSTYHHSLPRSDHMRAAYADR